MKITPVPRHPNGVLPAGGRSGSKVEQGGDGRPDWGLLVPFLVDPAKVAIIEALARAGDNSSVSHLRAELPDSIPEDQLDFHLRELVVVGAVVEKDQGLYALSVDVAAPASGS